jgi:thioredoxin 2
MNTAIKLKPDGLEAGQLACGHCFTPNRVARSRLRHDPKCGRCGERLLDGNPVALDDRSFDAFVAKSELPVLVDFWAPWCAPCRMMAPVLDAVASEFKVSVRVAKVDVHAAPVLAQRFVVMSIPTLVLLRQGRELQRIAGVMSVPQLAGWLAACRR